MLQKALLLIDVFILVDNVTGSVDSNVLSYEKNEENEYPSFIIVGNIFLLLLQGNL